MLSVKDFRTWGTPTPSPPIHIPDVGPTGTVWGDMVVEIHASPQPAPVSHESRSYTIEDSSGLDYEILRPIPVVLEKDEDCVVASFNEANIHASGDTFDEAIDNLASYIGDVLDEFLTLGEEVLGAGPRQELAVLSIYIRKRDAE